MYTAEILSARGNSRWSLILAQTISKSHLTNKRTAIADKRLRYRANRIHCQNDSAEISHPHEPADHRCSFHKQTLIPQTEREIHQTTTYLFLQPQLTSPHD